MKILICDDHHIVCDGLKKDIADFIPGNNSVDTVSDGEKALKLLHNKKFDLIIMDVKLPGKSGFEILSIIKKEWPLMPVLMFSGFDEMDYALKAEIFGASGYLNKECSTQDIIITIQNVAKGGKCFPAEVLQMKEDIGKYRLKAYSQSKHALLTDLRLAILTMIGDGLLNITISGKLGIKERTVSAHKYQIKKLMNFKDNSDIITYCKDNKLGKFKETINF